MLPRVFSLLYIFFHSPLGAHTFTGLAQDHRHRPWFQCHSCHDAGDPGDLLEDSSDIEPFSRLTSIKACNIAGLGPSAGVTFSGGARLVAVTGGELRQGREQFIHRPTHSPTHPFVHLLRKRHWKILTRFESLGFGDWFKIFVVDAFLSQAWSG